MMMQLGWFDGLWLFKSTVDEVKRSQPEITWWMWIVTHVGAFIINPYGAALTGAMIVVILYQLRRMLGEARKKIAAFRTKDEEKITNTIINNNNIDIKIYTRDMDVGEWIKNMDEYLETNGITRDDMRVKIMLNKMESSLKHMFKNYVDPNKNNNYEVIKKFLKNSQEQPDQASSVYRYDFDQRNQRDNENLHKYHIALSDLGRKAFPEADAKLLNKYVRDQFVRGLRSHSLRERLVTDHYNVVDPIELLEKATDLERLLNSVTRGTTNRIKKEFDNNEQNNRIRHNSGSRCWTCHKIGHKSRECLLNEHNANRSDSSGNRDNLNHRDHVNRRDANSHESTSIVEVRDEEREIRQLVGMAKIDTRSIKFLLDTGSSRSLLNLSVLDKEQIKLIQPYKAKVSTANGNLAHIVGVYKCKFQLITQVIDVEFLVAESLIKQ